MCDIMEHELRWTLPLNQSHLQKIEIWIKRPLSTLSHGEIYLLGTELYLVHESSDSISEGDSSGPWGISMHNITSYHKWGLIIEKIKYPVFKKVHTLLRNRNIYYNRSLSWVSPEQRIIIHTIKQATSSRNVCHDIRCIHRPPRLPSQSRSSLGLFDRVCRLAKLFTSPLVYLSPPMWLECSVCFIISEKR